jgi:hypothetical protein
MRAGLMVAAALVIVAGCSRTEQPSLNYDSRPTYVITAHTIVPSTTDHLPEDDYTVVYDGVDVLRVRYASSQTDPFHIHSRYSDPDVSQVPQVGVPIRRCEWSKDTLADGSPIIATQPTSAPCMVQFGDMLSVYPAPNSASGAGVAFDILSEKARRRATIGVSDR